MLIDGEGWSKILGSIGAKKASFSLLDSVTQKIFDSFSSGSGVDWSEFRRLRESFRSDQPFIDAEGRPFVLFVYDQALAYGITRHGITNHEYGTGGYKYHFSWCLTLERMNANGRRGRYKPKYDIDNNIFTVNKGRQSDEEIEMNVCKNCLIKMDYLGYSGAATFQRGHIYNAFNIAYFFSLKLPQDLLKPTHPFHTGRYTSDWGEISRRIKIEKGNKCEQCESREHLQVHHINGVKDDNRASNLRVLCYLHHSQQPYHSHMRYKVMHGATSKSKLA